jgi:hypothetical protein
VITRAGDEALRSVLVIGAQGNRISNLGQYLE